MAIINPGNKGPIGPRPAGSPAPAARPGQPAAPVASPSASPAAVPSPAGDAEGAELPEGAKSCPKCNSAMLTDNNGEFCWAVTAVVKDPEGRILYDPATGVPLAMYTCQDCGYLEFYSAIKTGLFTVPAQPPQG